MDFFIKVYNYIVLILGTIFGFLFGDTKGCITALVVLICLDFISGVLTGFVEKNLSSQVAWKGLVRKMYELLIVIAAHMVDEYVIGTGDVVLTAVCFLFISTEGISLLENAARLGVPIPRKLIEVLSQLKVKAGGIATVDDIKQIEAEAAKKSEEQYKNSELNLKQSSSNVSDDVESNLNDEN